MCTWIDKNQLTNPWNLKVDPLPKMEVSSFVKGHMVFEYQLIGHM